MIVEQRKNPRHSLRCKVMCTNGRGANVKFRTQSLNISVGGIALKIDNFLRCSGRLKLRIFAPDKSEPLEARGKLVWQKRFHSNDEMRAGVQFTSVPWTQLKSLIKNIA